MKNVKVKLPVSKYTVELKPYISVQLDRDYNDALSGKLSLEYVDNTEKVKIPASVYYDARDVLFKGLLVALYNENGEQVSDAYKEYMQLPAEDNKVVQERIDNMTQIARGAKKKSPNG